MSGVIGAVMRIRGPCYGLPSIVSVGRSWGIDDLDVVGDIVIGVFDAPLNVVP
jgi:hypothetical protein